MAYNNIEFTKEDGIGILTITAATRSPALPAVSS